MSVVEVRQLRVDRPLTDGAQLLRPPLMRLPFLVVIVLSACTPQATAPATSPAMKTASSAGIGERAKGAQAALGAVIIQTPTGAQRYAVELAIDPGQRNKGLMFREQLDADAGMLFVFEDMRIQSFWMKNTRIPLDMIFIDDELVIAGIVESAEPLTLTSRKVDKKSRFVLELAGGTSRQRGIAAGQHVTFEGVPAPPFPDPPLPAPPGQKATP